MGLREAVLVADSDLSEFLAPGWHKVDLSQSFPTFTTARPRDSPGRKPAGLQTCTPLEVSRWKDDCHRFPPYQYRDQHCVVNKAGTLRVPNSSERELLLGFPLHYTSMCLPKAERKSCAYNDCRLTLLGNTWSVPVISWLLAQLFSFVGYWNLLESSTSHGCVQTRRQCPGAGASPAAPTGGSSELLDRSLPLGLQA